MCEPNPFSSNIILQLLINGVVPGSAKSLTTFNHFKIMLSMWIQCVPPLQAIYNLSHRQQHPLWLSDSLQPQCNSALNLTIQATVHSARPTDHRFKRPPAFKQAIFHPASCQRTTNSLQSMGCALWSLSMAALLHATSPHPEP